MKQAGECLGLAKSASLKSRAHRPPLPAGLCLAHPIPSLLPWACTGVCMANQVGLQPAVNPPVTLRASIAYIRCFLAAAHKQVGDFTIRLQPSDSQ